jgi:hypothetical protein
MSNRRAVPGNYPAAVSDDNVLRDLGIPALTRLIGGLRSGWLYALCAAENASPMPLALTLAHRLAVEREVPVAFVCAAAAREWLLREIAWEDVAVAAPYHYRTGRTADEERQIAVRREANLTRPLYVLSREESAPGALEASLLALPRRPRLVVVDGEVRRQDTDPATLRRLASSLHVPVLLLCSLERTRGESPCLADVPEELAHSVDVLLAIGNPHFDEAQDEEAVPDHFHAPLVLLGAASPPAELLRFDLTTHRFAREE